MLGRTTRLSRQSNCSPPGARQRLACRCIQPEAVLARNNESEPAGTQASGREARHTPYHETRIPLGRVEIRPITQEDVQSAGVVLTRAFAGSAEAVALNDVLKDIDAILKAEAEIQSSSSGEKEQEGYFLVARLFPEEPGAAVLPAGQDSRLIGTASVSLTPDSKPIQRLPPVNLPPMRGAAYVSNMAVDPRFRRQGVARALLAACEDAARAGGCREVWLHVREADAPARALYAGAGYSEVAKDSWLDTMRHNMRPRVLMRRGL